MGPYLHIEPVTIHAEVGRGIAKPDEAGQPARPRLIIAGAIRRFGHQRSRPVSWTGAMRECQIRKLSRLCSAQSFNEWFIPCTGRELMLGRCRASIVVGLSPFKLTGLSGVPPAILVTLRRNTDGVKAAENWKSPR